MRGPNPGTRKRQLRVQYDNPGTRHTNQGGEPIWVPRDNPKLRKGKKHDATLVRLQQALEAHARAVQAAQGIPDEFYWQRAVPQALYNLLTIGDAHSSYLAASTFTGRTVA